MIFSRNVYADGLRHPQILARREFGQRFSPTWRLYYTALFANQVTSDLAQLPAVSPWHAVRTRPHQGQPIIHFINEIAKGTREKLELDLRAPATPLRQDRYEGTQTLRVFKYGVCPFNYGCIPRTWSDPTTAAPLFPSPTTPHKKNEKKNEKKEKRKGKIVGDGDALDVVEVSGVPFPLGGIFPVRVLGVLALADQGEADWKIIAVHADNPTITTAADIPSTLLATICDWFIHYKTKDNKKKNEILFDGTLQSAAFAAEVIDVASSQYNALRDGKLANPEKVWLPTSNTDSDVILDE